MPKAGAIVRGWEWFAEQLEKQTNGRYKVDFYPAQSLLKADAALQGVVSGVADIANAGVSSQQQAFPVTTVLSLPSVHFPDTTAGHVAALDARQQLLAKYPAMSNEFNKFKLFIWHTLPANLVVTKKIKVTVPDDLRGLKMASLGMDKDMVIAAGAAAVSLIPSASYESLEKGVVDGGTYSWIHNPSNHFEEICNYFMDYTFGHEVQLVLINWDKWNSFPAEVQKIITELAPETMARSDAAYMADILNGKKLAMDKNRVITVLTPEQMKLWDNIAQPLENNWLNDMKAKGIADAPEMLNFMKQRSAEAWAKSK